MKRKVVSAILLALLALFACAGCGSKSNSIIESSNTNSTDKSIISSVVSTESSKQENSKEISKVESHAESSKPEVSKIEKKITSIKLNNSDNVKVYDDECKYDYISLKGSGYNNYTNEVKFISTNPKVATVETYGNKGYKDRVYYKVKAVSAGITTIYAQTKNGELKTDKVTFTVKSKAEESRLVEESRLAEESKRAEESRLAEESKLAEESRKSEESRLLESSKNANTTNTRGNGNNFNTYDNEEQQNTTQYVLNTSTKKIHRSHCRFVKKIAPQNYSTTSDLQSALAQGYKECKKCF